MALENFGDVAADGTVGDPDAHVGIAVPIVRGAVDQYFGEQTYFRIDDTAQVRPCFQSFSGGDGSGSGCFPVSGAIRCGTRFWAQLSEIGRWEVVSIGHTSEGSGCPCTTFGYAVWRVIDDGEGNPIWDLVENRCSGCYEGAEGRPAVDGNLAKYRFTDLGMNEDWPNEPAIDPQFDIVGDNGFYVTCCGASTPGDHCTADCCYSLSFPNAICGDGESVGTTQIVMRGGGGGASCRWVVRDDVPMAGEGHLCDGWGLLRWFVLFAAMRASDNKLDVSIKWLEPSGWAELMGRYSLSGTLDCSGNLAATLDYVTGTNLDFTCTVDGSPSCGVSNEYLRSLFANRGRCRHSPNSRLSFMWGAPRHC